MENDDRADWSEAWALFPGAVAYVWHAGSKAGIVQDSLDRCDFETRAQIVWVKNNFAIGRGDYHWQHEPCWYAVRKGSTGHWGRRPRANHGVEHRQEPEIGDWPRHAKAGRVHAAADREQLLAWPGRL